MRKEKKTRKPFVPVQSKAAKTRKCNKSQIDAYDIPYSRSISYLQL